jgi:hypothetical protein
MSTVEPGRSVDTIAQRVKERQRKSIMSAIALVDGFHWKLTPLSLLAGHRKDQGPAAINVYLPTELLREIFLYCIEVNQMTSGQLASVCRRWRSVIIKIASLWSTLRVGTWTERERVATWLQRAYPKKIVIDTQTDRKKRSKAPAFAALQNALTSIEQWHELTISSFLPENLASQLDIQVTSTMNVLKVLHVAAGCVRSSPLARLLNLVSTEAQLFELRLHSPFASTHFIQPDWFPVLRNLTVLIVNGRDMDGPFELLPSFTQLEIFEADRLRLPFYEPNTNLPLLSTLRKLQLRACSVQWMAGRQFPCLEDCAILLPRHWEVIWQHEIQLPFCKKLNYHGHPISTAQYFRAPKMREMGLISHDCNEQRVYQQLRHLCRVDGRISSLTTLHLTFQCSEQVLINLMKYLVSLQELVLSVAHPSPSWQDFLESLAAEPSTNEWPVWSLWEDCHSQLEKWCSHQTWHANVLPQLKYFGIQCPKGFSQSECLDNLPFLRLVAWTRAYLTPPLEHLKVWEGRGSMDDLAIDYISTRYQDRHLGISSKECDAMIVMGMATQCLAIYPPATPLFLLHSTVLFRHLQHLKLICDSTYELPILPYLEQIKRLEVFQGSIPEYSLKIDLPLAHTLQRFILYFSTSSWMFGRTFRALIELLIDWSVPPHENLSRHEGLQVNLPACTTLMLKNCPINYFHFLSCPKIQHFHWEERRLGITFDLMALNSLHDFVFTLSCLKTLYIYAPQGLGIHSLIHFVFCGALEQGVWRDIRSVEVEIQYDNFSEASHLFDQTVGRYEKWWKTFTVTKKYGTCITVSASM